MDEELLEAERERVKALPGIQECLERLGSELPSDLFYHSRSHTEEVLTEVLRFALHDQLSERERELLAYGAVFHDIGFLKKRRDNEWLSARAARDAMEQAREYTESEIQLVEEMILDTQLVETALGAKQIPSEKLACYLLDADLGNLGRDDFFEKTELLRRELGLSRELFLRDALRFLEGHDWLTPAAKALRAEKQKANENRLRQKLEKPSKAEEADGGLPLERLLFLARLPLLLSSSLDLERIVTTALEHLKKMTAAEAATVFLLNPEGDQLRFWALSGDVSPQLKDQVMPSDQGIVGWVLQHQEPVCLANAKEDSRFFANFDQKSGFDTRDLICLPLTVGGDNRLGAIQVLNKRPPQKFTDGDVTFLDHFSHQLALALQNGLLYREAQRMKQSLAKLDKKKSDMITVLSHEIRTPLNVIQGAASLLSEEDDTDAELREKMAGTLRRGVDRLLRISSQLQGLSRIQPGRIEIEMGEVDSIRLSESVLDPLKDVFQKRSIRLQSRIEPVRAKGDESLLFVVLTNLVSNAIRFTPDGGEVGLRIMDDNGFARFEVSDTGIGIPKDEQELIFQKFYEVGDALMHSSGDYEFRSGGLGIGLSTVKEILRAHGTGIEVDSEPEKGSIFRFRLPLNLN